VTFVTNKRNLSATESMPAHGMWAPPCHPPEECRFIPLGRSAPMVDVVLLHKLQTIMHAILVPVHPALRMFVVAAFLGGNVNVYRFPTIRAVPDWGVRAPVIHVSTPFPLDFHYLLSN
jgi:hypothetical protein